MRRLGYALVYSICSLIGIAVEIWVVAPYVSTGVEAYLPGKNALTWSIAAVAFLITSVWRQRARPPSAGSSLGLSARAISPILKLAFWAAVTALARFTFPLFTSWFGPFSVKPDGTAAIAWFSVLYVSIFLLRILPVFVKHVTVSADELMATDTRKPVLYFRSFEKELRKAVTMRWTSMAMNYGNSPAGFYITSNRAGGMSPIGRTRLVSAMNSKRTAFDEQLIFADAFHAIGPYVALGRPNESFRDMDLGAAKKYVPDEEWQDTVHRWLWQCGAVVLEAGDSASLGWEIEQVVRLIPPFRVLVICPYTDDEYGAFAHAYEGLFPRGLPNQRPASRLLIFGMFWHPSELENINMDASETLEPFFARVQGGEAGSFPSAVDADLSSLG